VRIAVMTLVIGRLFLFMLLVADYAGDPYFGQSPLSRPGAFQDAFCQSVVQREVLLHATTAASTMPALHVKTHGLHALDACLSRGGQAAEPVFLPATDPLYGLMSLQR